MPRKKTALKRAKRRELKKRQNAEPIIVEPTLAPEASPVVSDSADVPQEQPEDQFFEELQKETEEILDDPLTDEQHERINRAVRLGMYGTDQPSKHDRLLSLIRERGNNA